MRKYWWPEMKKDVSEFVENCLVCQPVKLEDRLGGHLLPLKIPKCKCKDITCDFVAGLSKIKSNHGTIWVVVVRLTKSAHFILGRMNTNMQ